MPQSTDNPRVNQVEEYESDSDDSDNDVDIESEEPVIGKPIMTRSGRQVKVWTRFDEKTRSRLSIYRGKCTPF